MRTTLMTLLSLLCGLVICAQEAPTPEPTDDYGITMIKFFPPGGTRLKTVSLSLDYSVGIAEDASMELYEQGVEQPLSIMPLARNYNVNCYCADATFPDIQLVADNSYTLVIPEGALYLVDDDTPLPAISYLICWDGLGSKYLVDVRDILVEDTDNIGSDSIFDLQGRMISTPVPGQPFIKDGKIMVER